MALEARLADCAASSSQIEAEPVCNQSDPRAVLARACTQLDSKAVIASASESNPGAAGPQHLPWIASSALALTGMNPQNPDRPKASLPPIDLWLRVRILFRPGRL